MNLTYLGNSLLSMKRLILLCVYIILIGTLSGCASVLIKDPYSPAYIEKRAVVESNVKASKSKSVFILPFIDKRKDTDDPYHIYKSVKLDGQTLSKYLHSALTKDFELMGLRVIQGGGKNQSFKEIESGNNTVKDDIHFVLEVVIHECATDYKMNWSTIEPYSTIDFHVKIWDRTKLKTVFDKRLNKRVNGTVTGSATFESMAKKLLNEDLTVMNVDIAEILVGL